MKMKITETQTKTNENFLKGKQSYERHMYQEAVAFFRKAYAEGCLEAACKLGETYMNKHVLDYERAFHWLTIAAEQNDAEAQFCLSRLYESGLLEKYDLKKSYEWLSRAVAQKESHAMLQLSFWYRTGIYVPKDKDCTLHLLLQLSEMGNQEAICQLGKEYESGDLVGLDHDKSWACYEKAARRHHPYALYRLGQSYWNNRLSSNNVQKAVDCLKESSIRGCREAQYLLATICGTYFYHHIYERYHWLTVAAGNGHPEAMYDLACLFLFGNSFLSADEERAAYWFEKAKKCGYRKKKRPVDSLLMIDFGSDRFGKKTSLRHSGL